MLPLRRETDALEANQRELALIEDVLLRSIKNAMTCLPPPSPLRKSPTPGGAASSSGAGGSAETSAEASRSDGVAEGGEDGEGEGGTTLSMMERVASDLVLSARQAAHANARLGHAMSQEREGHMAARALAQKRLSYLSAEVNSRLLFTPQADRRLASSSAAVGSSAGVAFAALMLPTLRGGQPSHWLSAESVESLRRWCEDEGMPLQALKCVVGRVVHISGPIEVPAADASHDGSESRSSGKASDRSVVAIERADENVYNLPAGEHYYVVHAEMVMQHRWSVL